MKGQKHIRILICVILMATILTSACASTPASTPLLESTATFVPTVTSIPVTIAPTPTSLPATITPFPTSATTATPIPLLLKPPELILAVNKPVRKTDYPEHVVYTLPEMDKVLLASELPYYHKLTVDIYYPPNYQFETKLPFVILSHGYEDGLDKSDKDIPQHVDWAKLIAASGMIAISAQTGLYPVENSFLVFDYLAKNANMLGIDLTRIGFWACSGQGYPMFLALEDINLPYRDAFKAAVFMYLDLTIAEPSFWPENLSLFVVKAASDKNIDSSIMDKFVSEAHLNNIPTDYIELADAPHGFDVLLDTQASKDIVQKALEFLRIRLLP